MILTQEQHFENAINHNPADLETRCAYIDWMYEQGRVEEADKWLAIQHKCPFIQNRICFGWYGETSPRVPQNCKIPSEVYKLEGMASIMSPFYSFTRLVNKMIEHNIKEIP